MLWWIITLLFIIFIYKYIIIPHKYWQKNNVAHVKPWPFFGSAAPIVFQRKSLPEWMQELYNTCDDQQYNYKLHSR